MEQKDLYWMVGLLEGEGCFTLGTANGRKYHRVVLRMTDLDIVERFAKLVDQNVHHAKIYPGKKQPFVVTLTGRKARDLMRMLRGHMGSRRRARIDEVLKY